MILSPANAPVSVVYRHERRVVQGASAYQNHRSTPVSPTCKERNAASRSLATLPSSKRSLSAWKKGDHLRNV
jgi:hypothetical protein